VHEVAWLGFGRRVPRVSTKHSTDEWFGWLPRAVERMALRGAADVLAVSDAAARAKSYLGRQGMLPAVIESPPSVAVPTRRRRSFSGTVRRSCL